MPEWAEGVLAIIVTLAIIGGIGWIFWAQERGFKRQDEMMRQDSAWHNEMMRVIMVATLERAKAKSKKKEEDASDSK